MRSLKPVRLLCNSQASHYQKKINLFYENVWGI